MIDLNTIRAEFARRLSADSTRFSMDAALAHVVEMAYRQGIQDGMSIEAKQDDPPQQ